jgi:galactose oxidase
MFDPSSSSWTTLASAKNIRSYHSEALLLDTGHVVTTGSEMNNYYDYWPTPKANCFTNLDVFLGTSPSGQLGCTDAFNYNIERFSPPYMASVGPVIENVTSTTTHGSLIQIDMDSTKNVGMISFIRLSTVTHSTNTDQRFIELVVNASDTKSLFVRIPENVALAPVGLWFIFAVSKSGVPSVAKTVSLGLGPATEVLVPDSAKPFVPKQNGDVGFGLSVSMVLISGLLAVLFS